MRRVPAVPEATPGRTSAVGTLAWVLPLVGLAPVPEEGIKSCGLAGAHGPLNEAVAPGSPLPE